MHDLRISSVQEIQSFAYGKKYALPVKESQFVFTLKQFMHEMTENGAAIFFGAAAVLFIMAWILSRQAAAIFNLVAERQHFLEGHITVETLSATPLGHVHFQNLVWESENGEDKVVIPDGRFHVKPLDIILRRPSTSTIDSLELNGADIALTFDERMHIKGIRAIERVQSPPGDRHKAKKPFDIKLKNLNVEVTLNHCRLTAYYKTRIHTFSDVNAKLHYDSKDKLTIDFHVIVAYGVSIAAVTENLISSVKYKVVY